MVGLYMVQVTSAVAHQLCPDADPVVEVQYLEQWGELAQVLGGLQLGRFVEPQYLYLSPIGIDSRLFHSLVRSWLSYALGGVQDAATCRRSCVIHTASGGLGWPAGFHRPPGPRRCLGDPASQCHPSLARRRCECPHTEGRHGSDSAGRTS